MQHLIPIGNDWNAIEISFHIVQENITIDKSIATNSLCSICLKNLNIIQERSATCQIAARLKISNCNAFSYGMFSLIVV